MIGWIITFLTPLVVGIAGTVGWKNLQKEHDEARSLALNSVDFTRLKDGTFTGIYGGGMYGWRANQCQVTVTSGRVNRIDLVQGKEAAGKTATQPDMLYERVIHAQSLQVDTISGATLTSKAYLQAVENALLQVGF